MGRCRPSGYLCTNVPLPHYCPAEPLGKTKYSQTLSQVSLGPAAKEIKTIDDVLNDDAFDQLEEQAESIFTLRHVDQDGDAWIFLLEKAEAWQRAMQEGAKRKRSHEKYRGTAEWLRLLDSNQRLGG